MRSRLAILFIVAALAAAGAHPRSRPRPICKGNPELVGSCFRVRGRAFISNGTPVDRIWVVGTNRILGITGGKTADDAIDAIAPDNLLRALHANSQNPNGDFVFGDFEVCPFTPERKGAMQMVCVETAQHLVEKPYGYGTKP
jgi:hypothetical protein